MDSTASGKKRKAEDLQTAGDKRTKTKKQWQTPRQQGRGSAPVPSIQPGDSGIWATCDKGREGKCIGELRDLFAQYAEKLYGSKASDDSLNDEAVHDIESEIQAEVDGIRKPTEVQLFTPIRVDVQCVVFFRTIPPVDPVALVKQICQDAVSQALRRRTRFVKRLSPMTLMGRASEDGLDKVARQVLAPHFHEEPYQIHKFAIRPTLRNHSVLKRDTLIQQVASLVGPRHPVDLKNYDRLIVVEAYQNICGVSVLDNDFERLKRFNLAEIFEPTPQDKPKGTEEKERSVGTSAEEPTSVTASTN